MPLALKLASNATRSDTVWETGGVGRRLDVSISSVSMIRDMSEVLMFFHMLLIYCHSSIFDVP
jgi:hypothetical protein